jgi:hypothetical protein
MSSKSRRRRSQQTRRQMPWLWMLVAGMVLVLVGGGVLALSSKPPAETSSQVAAGEPKLVVDRTLVEEGYVKFNVPVRSTFHLTNVGDQPLKILNAPVELVEGC